MPQQIAQCDENGGGGVFYRHGIAKAEPVFAKPGETLPDLPDEGQWWPLAHDNTPATEVTLIIGKGLMGISSVSRELVVTGAELNMLYVGPGEMWKTGRYRLGSPIKSMQWNGDALHGPVERVGDIDPTKLVHILGLANC